MKALSLTQPWATLIAIEAKRYETRSWQSWYVGQLAIHAAKGLGAVGGKRGLIEMCHEQPFLSALNESTADFTVELPLGAIIATCTLTACWPTEQVAPQMSKNELKFGDFSEGRWAWRLINVWKLPEPVPCKGTLGIWEVPADVEAQIQAQITQSKLEKR
jgi:hypothetical protein